MTDWIQVDQKLPLLYETVLLTTKHGKVFIGRLVPLAVWEAEKAEGQTKGFESDMLGHVGKSQLGEKGVTHWMPIPIAPPKG